MKKKTLKRKILIWFSASIIIVSAIGFAATVCVSRFVIQKEITDNLIATVEGNYDEVEFYEDFDEEAFDDPYDLYMQYQDGYLEIDDDFLKQVNGITTLVFDEDELVYGDNSVFKKMQPTEFRNRSLRSVSTDSGKYYIYDIEKKAENSHTFWFRGYVSAESGIGQVNNIVKFSLCIIPFIIILSIVGGYFIAKRALDPVTQINEAAYSISEGNDLSKRIDIGEGSDELHSIADSFNAMFERLENSFNKEQQLTSDISHELRTPVTVILSQCQYTLEEDRTGEEYVDAVRLISRQARKMSSLINDMLSFARLERGAGKVVKERINLSGCIKIMCEDMAMIGDKNISMTYDIQPDIYIEGNSELISRMVANLISNAYSYGRENGSISVTFHEKDGRNILCVQDDGIGISKDNLDKIWNRFFRGDASRSSKGNGLGLSFVKEIAAIHNAEVKVESEENKGSRFFVIF